MRLGDLDALKDILIQRRSELTGVAGDLGGALSGVIKLIDNAPTVTNGTYEQGFRVGAYGRLDELRPKGKWVEVEKQGKTGDGRIFTYTVVVCSECGEQFDLEGEKFCPHCGADMRGKEE